MTTNRTRWIVLDVTAASLAEFAKRLNHVLDTLSSEGYAIEHIEKMTAARVEVVERNFDVTRDRFYTVVRARREDDTSTYERAPRPTAKARRERVLAAIAARAPWT